MERLRKLSTEPEFLILETSMDIMVEQPDGLPLEKPAPKDYDVDLPDWHYGD